MSSLLLCALAGAVTLPLPDSGDSGTGDTGTIGLPTDTDTDGTGADTDPPAVIVWSEGEGAAEKSGETGGHSWKGCSAAPAAPLFALPLLLWTLRRPRR